MRPSKLKERLAQLGQIRGIDRVSSGSPAAFVLRPSAHSAEVKAVTATEVLARHGLTLLRAKRSIEHMLEEGQITIQVPVVADIATFSRVLAEAGVNATAISTRPLDVRAVRERLGLSQEQFARRYNLELDAVQNWEQGRRKPDRTLQSYLRVISAYPDIAAQAQEEK